MKKKKQTFVKLLMRLRTININMLNDNKTGELSCRFMLKHINVKINLLCQINCYKVLFKNL